MYQKATKINYSDMKPDEFNHKKKLYKHNFQESQIKYYLLKYYSKTVKIVTRKKG